MMKRISTPQSEFTKAASYYDAFNIIFSLGSIGRIRRYASDYIIGLHPRVLDICCGTGEFGRICRKYHQNSYIVGVDLNNSMLDQAKKKLVYDKLIAHDASLPINFADKFEYVALNFCYFDLGPTSSVALQNITSYLKTNGTLLSIEFSKPRNPVIVAIFKPLLVCLKYLFQLANFRAPAHLMQEIIESPPSSFLRMQMQMEGFTTVATHEFAFGHVTLNVFRRNS